MADEQQTTDATNSDPATPMGDAAATATTTSTTEATPGQPQADVPADPLDADTGLAADAGDTSTDAGTEGGEGDEGDADGDDSGDETPPALTGAPEGDYELTLPEGMALDTAALEEIAPLARDLNLSNAGLSALAEKGLPVAEKIINRHMVEQVIEQRQAWETSARQLVQGGKDAEGKEIAPSPLFRGANFDAVLTTCAKAIDRLTTDESGQPLMFPGAKVDPKTGETSEGTFRDFLKSTGLGNHPALMVGFYRAGMMISEDSDFERSDGIAPTKLTREAKYYPNRTQT